MLLYDIKELDILLENEETAIISYSIRPIKRRSYMFLFYEKDGKLFMKSSEYSSEELVGLIQEFFKKDMAMRNSLEKVVRENTFIDIYKKRFVHTIEINDGVLTDMIKRVANINVNYPKTKYVGLDGFSLDCYTPKWDKPLHLWCYSKDEYFQDVIDLANYLLDFTAVDAKYRFRLDNDS